MVLVRRMNVKSILRIKVLKTMETNDGQVTRVASQLSELMGAFLLGSKPITLYFTIAAVQTQYPFLGEAPLAIG